MLLLCSDGLSSAALLDGLKNAAEGCRSAALVVTADNEYKENNYHVKRCADELKALGLEVDIFDIDRQSSELLRDYDVVELIGGNPFYLLSSVREHNAAEVLRYLADNRVLIGWSAAVFVLSPTLELVNRYSPEMNFMGLTELRGLSLTEVEVLPHYSRFLTKFERFEEKCREYEREHNVSVIRLNDGDGVFVDGGRVRICRAGGM